MMPRSSSATSSARSPRSAAAAMPRQNCSARSSGSGSMKPTESPPSTMSISTSASARAPRCRETVVSRRYRHASTTRVAGLGIRRVVEGDRAIERHRQAVARVEAMPLGARGDVDRPLEHPDLLVHQGVTRAGLVGDARTRREGDVDDLDRAPNAGGRDVAAHVAGCGIAPRGLFGSARHGAREGAALVEERGQREVEAGRELLQHHGRRAALAALDQRDHRAADAAGFASASSERPRAARCSRTAAAMRSLTVSVMLEAVSSIVDGVSRVSRARVKKAPLHTGRVRNDLTYGTDLGGTDGWKYTRFLARICVLELQPRP